MAVLLNLYPEHLTWHGDVERYYRDKLELFRNLGDGTFEDVTEEARVGMGRWAWGSRFVDFNNDGLDDILIANGFISTPDTGDL